MTNKLKEVLEIKSKAKCLYSRKEIEKSLDRVALELEKKLAKTNPIFIFLLNGAIVSFGCLLPRLNFPLEVDYAHVTRYGHLANTKNLVWKAVPGTNLKGRTVVIFDDILDEGVTLAAVIEYCKKQGAKKVFSAVLLEKEKKRSSKGLQKADFVCLKSGDEFVFGYGLDLNGYCRNVPGIYIVK